MEAAPRLPMISFELLTCTEPVQFGKKLKPYIASFYNEDPESYNSEISKIDALRANITHPTMDVSGVELLKKYYCQLHFLKSRFPMDHNQPCFIEFEWRDCQNGASVEGIDFELMAVMFNIGVMHTILGAQDSRSTPEGMKLAYSHFQCAAWAFQVIKEKYLEYFARVMSVEVTHFYKQVCLAQAQECILEKSMLDNRNSTIISKVAVQVCDYYRQAFSFLSGINEDIFSRARYKDLLKYLQFKLAYHRCISMFFQGQQAEVVQRMGERVAFYQAASEQLEEARRHLSSKQQSELADALAFTADVVEGKKKAAKNENEFIYHEEVPDITNLQEVKGAPLVKLIEFSVNDPEVSGPDIFARLVPMEAHEAASLYSEKKAQLLRRVGEQIEIRDQALVEFMSSMQLDVLTKMHQATGIPQELIDRAAALSAKPNAIQDLIDSMDKLTTIYHDVETNLNEIDIILKEEEENEKSYQEIMGKRPASIITTDLAREASKYKEAHTKANESNQTLKKAMMTHMENLKILQTPIRELQQRLPSVEFPDANIDQNILKELEMLNAKVDEMRTQRAMLWAQLRDSVHNDDITNALVTKPENVSLDKLFTKEIDKHSHLASLLEQNLAAQENVKKAFIDCYARAVNTRRYIQDLIQKRNSTVQALIASHDSYDDLLAKANKGIEFYTKLETNVSKLLQRIRSANKVQQEEREQLLAKTSAKKVDHPAPAASGPKLKDYLEARKKAGSMASYSPVNYGSLPQNLPDSQNWPPSVRPAPVGSEINTDPAGRFNNENTNVYYPHQNASYASTGPSGMTDLTSRMSGLMGKQDHCSVPVSSSYNPQYSYSNYIPQNYSPAPYTASQNYSYNQDTQQDSSGAEGSKASTVTTNSYHTITSYMPNVPKDSTNPAFNENSVYNQTPEYSSSYQYGNYSSQKTDGQAKSGGLVGNQQIPNAMYQQYLQQYQYMQSQAQNQTSYPQSQVSPNLQQQNVSQYPQQYNTPQQYSQNSQISSQQQQQQQQPYGTTGQQQYAQQHAELATQQQYASKNVQVPVTQQQNVHAINQQYANQSALTPQQRYFPTQNSQASTAQQPNRSTYNPGSETATGQIKTTVSLPAFNIQDTTNQLTPQGGSSQVGTAGVYSQYQNAATYSQTPAYNTQPTDVPQNYYPYGYDPNFTSGVTVPSQNMYNMSPYMYQYYNQEHASSVASSVASPTNYSTYSSPSSDIYKIQAGSATPYNISTGVSQANTSTASTPVSSHSATYNYASTYGYNQSAYPNTATTYSYTQPTMTTQVPTAGSQANTATSKSNIDLLSGLDFSASQIPTLTPQQNIPVEKPKEPEPQPKQTTIEVKPHIPTPIKEESTKETIRVLPTKPLNNTEVKNLFTQELDKYEKYVETLTTKILSGPTTLELKWKEIQDCQELDNQKKVISVARCYPMKNRYPDILPYDYSRVVLNSTDDDYINASLVQQLSPFNPQFIVTQAPLPATYGDFWAMIREQQVELIFCPLNEKEIGGDVYWPNEKGKNMNVLNMVLTLQNVVVKPNWIERLILISVPEKKESWVVMHLQFVSWPGSLFPTTPEPFISYVLELINLSQQQKSTGHPVVVHCSSGIGRSGLICLLTDAILNVTNQVNAVPDLAMLAAKLGNYRKNILRDREHLRFAYEALLCYMKQVLLQDNMKKKLSEVVPVKEEPTVVAEVQENIIDPLSTLDPFWASKK